jgi:hypothetical protein
MSDRRRPPRDLHLGLKLRGEMSDWPSGQRFLEPLFADPALAPVRVAAGNEISARHGVDVAGLAECAPCWGQREEVRAQGQDIDSVAPFYWKAGRPADAKGWVRFPGRDNRGSPNPGSIGVEARGGKGVDWHRVLVSWCEAFQPESGLLHPCLSQEDPGPPVNLLDCSAAEELMGLAWSHFGSASLHPRFRAGPQNSVVEGLTNLGWATWFGPDLARHVDAPALQAAGFALDRIGAGWLLRLSARIEEVERDFARFARLRAKARALFPDGLFLLPPDAGVARA